MENVGAIQSRSEFLLRQRITLMVNRYELYEPVSPGSKEEGELLVFVEQKRMKLREQIDFFADREKTTLLFSVKAENILDPRGRYQVLEPNGYVIARFKKNFAQSLLRSSWQLQDAEGNETGVAKERNLFAALFRRFATLVPYIGEFLGLMPIAYHFDFRAPDETLEASVERIWSIRDRYRLMVTDDGQDIDRRLLVGMAVCMDALQRR